jgi:hypothetical protein
MGSKAYESPLLSHARMRAIFRALVETRILGETKPRRPATGWPRNFEACWVGTAIDLKPSDLVSIDQAPGLLDHVRAIGARNAPVTPSGLSRVLQARSAPRTKPPAFDRLLTAVGMAMALKSTGSGVVMAYTPADALATPEWKRLLALAAQGDLPLVLVATPGRLDLPALAKPLPIPVIPVDAADPVALYRVTQETLVRARAEGGLAIIQCVDCGLDPIQLLGTQLVKKKICTEHWISTLESSFRERIARS